MSHKQYTPVKKDEAKAKTSLIRFLTTEEQAKQFEDKLASKGEKASTVLREFLENYITK